MAEITDLLKLNYSQSFDIQGMQEADINLSLSPAVPAAATVYGTVTDGTNPLPNATVKLFDSQGVPYRHVLTDTEGAYAFTNVTGEGAARVERLIAATKTNAEGKYLFGGVTGGTYIVKAKQSA